MRLTHAARPDDAEIFSLASSHNHKSVSFRHAGATGDAGSARGLCQGGDERD